MYIFLSQTKSVLFELKSQGYVLLTLTLASLWLFEQSACLEMDVLVL